MEFVAFSGNGRLGSLMAGARRAERKGDRARRLRVWDILTGRQVYSIPNRCDGCGTAAFSPDGRWVASISTKATIDIANAKNGRVVHTLPLPKKIDLPSLRFSADSRRIAAIQSTAPIETAAIRIWAVDNGNIVASWSEQGVSDDGPYSLWRDVSSKKGIRIARPADYSDNSEYVTLSPTFRQAAVRYAQFVSIVDLESAKEVRRIKSNGFISGFMDGPVRFSPDGKQLALETTPYEGAIRLIDVETGAKNGVFRGHKMPVREMWFSQDGGTLVATTDFRVYVWDVKTRKLRPYCDGHEIVTKVAFSRDGRFVASEGLPQVVDSGTTENLPVPTSGDGVRVWDAQSGRQRYD
ncbi:MAG: WD40 repeat domain-containing protein, partial [Planctomycetaceae bacterium]